MEHIDVKLAAVMWRTAANLKSSRMRVTANKHWTEKINKLILRMQSVYILYFV